MPIATAHAVNELILKLDGHLVKLTHLNKVLYPQARFTKKSVLNYYRKIAPTLLPHLEGKPITLKRFPDGVEGESFYEKRHPPAMPGWVGQISLNGIDFTSIRGVNGLLWVVNLASLELHPYLSANPHLARPLAVVFDLDPGEGMGVLDCAQVALDLKRYFDSLELKSFPKTSGGKGLQLYVPLNTPVTFEETKSFALETAKKLTRRHPKEVLWQMSKILRRGKVMIDWSQNDVNKTTVSVYSLRAGPKPLVSTPVTWQEIESAVHHQDARSLRFTPEDVIRRVARLGDLFAPVLTTRQRLPKRV